MRHIYASLTACDLLSGTQERSSAINLLNKNPLGNKMELIKTYIKFNIRIIYIIHRELLLKFDKTIFQHLFNLRSIICFQPSRLKWNGTFFEVSDQNLKNIKYVIRHQRQCNMAYEHGLEARAKSLSAAYFLHRVPLRDGDTIIDCGANVGDFKLALNLHVNHFNYIAFEPSPVEYKCLKQNIGNDAAHNFGLWDNDGEMNFFVSSQGADSSLIMPPSYDERIDVPVARLDRFIDNEVKLLKVEAEGAEPEVLMGLGGKLDLIHYITADVGYERGVRSESTLAPVTNYLLDHGFELVEVGRERLCALYRNKKLNSLNLQ